MPLDEASFRVALKESTRPVAAVAEWLRSTYPMWDITVPDVRVRPDRSQRDAYADSGDILIDRGFGPERIEVKGRGCAFTDEADFPFPDVFVDSAYHIDNADPFPVAWFFVDRDCSHAGIVPAKTRSLWKRQNRYDRQRRHSEDFYSVPLWAVSWINLT